MAGDFVAGGQADELQAGWHPGIPGSVPADRHPFRWNVTRAGLHAPVGRIAADDPARALAAALEFVVTAGPARPSGTFELTEAAEQGSTVMRFALDLQPAGMCGS
jgi:hypothetical protein